MARAGSELVGELRVDLVADELPPPSYNVAPTDPVAIVLDSARTEPPTRRLEVARWGLIPSWAKDTRIGARAFNARSEELEEKAMFQKALQKRRAIIPSSGYYEWKLQGGVKVPHFIHPEDDSPLLFAGLYEWWKDPQKADDDPARWVLSFTILTRDAIGALGSIHDRMPVFLDADHADAWLDPTVDYPRDVLDAAVDAAPYVAEHLVFHPVAKEVGSVRNNSPELIRPVDAA